MVDQPLWEQIGSSFVQHYYQLFDSDRSQLGTIYIDESCLTWEGQQFQGKKAIVGKLNSLPFPKIVHSITVQDHQPTPDCNILSMVVGQLKKFNRNIWEPKEEQSILDSRSGACVKQKKRAPQYNFGCRLA
uniref:NTF2-related export protein n=1 Tax=Gasterosteus aculeatus aculeatus TaxID=481459 RepID=A0AAQ4RXA6_GASAC